MQKNLKKRVGVLRGGTGEYYTPSLKRGGEIILYISENLSDKYKPVDILIDKDHVWHLGGLPIGPSDLMHKVDVVWNMAHPGFSNILESLSIPNIGVNSFSHLLQNSKEMLREHMKKIGINIPRHILFPVYQKDLDLRYAEGFGKASGPREKYAIKKAKMVFEKFGSPWIVKPASPSLGGSFTPDSSMGVHLAKTFNELVSAIEDGVRYEKSILVEEFIEGKVSSAHSLPHFRGEECYVFPPVDVLGKLSFEEKEKLASLTKDLHKHIGAGHYLKSNFLLNKRGKVYLLDLEHIPDLKDSSHFSKACESVGAKMHHVVEHILENAQ